MSKTVAYETYVLRAGKWDLVSVSSGKEGTLADARRLLDNRHLSGVKVLQETYNDETSDSTDIIIFNEVKGASKPAHAPRQRHASPSTAVDIEPAITQVAVAQEAVAMTAQSIVTRNDADIFFSCLKYVLAGCVVLLAGIFVVFVYVSKFGSIYLGWWN